MKHGLHKTSLNDLHQTNYRLSILTFDRSAISRRTGNLSCNHQSMNEKNKSLKHCTNDTCKAAGSKLFSESNQRLIIKRNSYETRNTKLTSSKVIKYFSSKLLLTFQTLLGDCLLCCVKRLIKLSANRYKKT